MDEGAPNAVQVADRFHLMQNLQETLETLLNSYSSLLKAVEQQGDKTKHPQRRSLLFHPPHCPEVNSIEQVWQYLKRRLCWSLPATLD